MFGFPGEGGQCFSGVQLQDEFADLPANARRYLDFLTKTIGAPMVILSIGPGREQTIRLDDVF